MFCISILSLQLLDNEQRAMELEADVRLLGELTSEASNSLDAAQNDLNTVSDELAQLYHHVCTVNGETPSRVLLDHEKDSKPGNIFHSINQISVLMFLLYFDIKKRRKIYSI